MSKQTGWEHWAWAMVGCAVRGDALATGEQVTDATLVEIHKIAAKDGARLLASAAWAATSYAHDQATA